jgi:hypothetical protein
MVRWSEFTHGGIRSANQMSVFLNRGQKTELFALGFAEGLGRHMTQ